MKRKPLVQRWKVPQPDGSYLYVYDNGPVGNGYVPAGHYDPNTNLVHFTEPVVMCDGKGAEPVTLSGDDVSAGK